MYIIEEIQSPVGPSSLFLIYLKKKTLRSKPEIFRIKKSHYLRYEIDYAIKIRNEMYLQFLLLTSNDEQNCFFFFMFTACASGFFIAKTNLWAYSTKILRLL